MSALPLRAPSVPSPRPAGTTWRPRLKIVRAPANARSLLPFTALCLTILLGALIGALMLNTTMAATSYEIRDQQIQLARLSEREQDLTQQVERLAAPTQLAEAASDLGMERAEGSSYITLSNTTIAGPAAGLIGEE